MPGIGDFTGDGVLDIALSVRTDAGRGWYPSVVLIRGIERDAAQVPASDFALLRGVLIEGELEDSFASDDVRMRFNPGFTLNSEEAPVWLIFNANLPTDSPSSLVLTVEAQAGTPGLSMTTEAWNWNTNSYEVVDVSETSFNADSVITPALTPVDHVQSETAAVDSRIGWRKTGLTLNYPWETRLDQFVWVVE